MRDHRNERKYACDKCPNQYKQKSHLDRHIEASHLGVKHKCTRCEKEFSKSWSLKMHMFVHSETKRLPYQCTICENCGFQRRDKLNKHMLKMHPNESAVSKNEPIQIVVPEDVKSQKNNEESILQEALQEKYIVISSAPSVFTIQNGSYIQTIEIVNG